LDGHFVKNQPKSAVSAVSNAPFRGSLAHHFADVAAPRRTFQSASTIRRMRASLPGRGSDVFRTLAEQFDDLGKAVLLEFVQVVFGVAWRPLQADAVSPNCGTHGGR
jgi:hypothetical protein